MYSSTTLSTKSVQSIWPYVQIARVDHWFKNTFMLLGALLAFFYEPALLTWTSIPQLGLALLATCLVASSNYVVNELLDAPYAWFIQKRKIGQCLQEKYEPVMQSRSGSS